MTIDNLIYLAETYRKRQNLALSTLGRKAMGHGHFFDRLAEGRITIRRAERAMLWFSDHWPSDLDWPSDIPRPLPSQASHSSDPIKRQTS